MLQSSGRTLKFEKRKGLRVEVMFYMDWTTTNYEVEWVHGEEEGLAFKDGFWGKEGLDSRSPGGTGKDSTEVWFKGLRRQVS